MVIAVLQIELDIPGAQSLKDKRRVIKSIKDACHRHHMASVSEVGSLDVWNRSILGIAVVSNSGMVAAQSLDRITERIREGYDAQVITTTREVVRMQDLKQAAELDTDAIDKELLAYAGGES